MVNTFARTPPHLDYLMQAEDLSDAKNPTCNNDDDHSTFTHLNRLTVCRPTPNLQTVNNVPLSNGGWLKRRVSP
jgi:hypothetical protein